MSFTYDEVFFHVDGKSFVKVREVTDRELSAMSFGKVSYDLLKGLSYANASNPDGTSKKASGTPLAVVDCEETLLYIIVEQKISPHSLDIFDTAGGQVAYVNSNPAQDLLTFKDANDTTVAVAASPAIGANNLKQYNLEADPVKGDIQWWELQVQEGDGPLTSPEKQWLLGVAVQMHAIRDAQRWKAKNGQYSTTPWPVIWLSTFAVFLVASLVGCAIAGLWNVYLMVYPEEPRRLLEEKQ